MLLWDMWNRIFPTGRAFGYSEQVEVVIDPSSGLWERRVKQKTTEVWYLQFFGIGGRCGIPEFSMSNLHPSNGETGLFYGLPYGAHLNFCRPFKGFFLFDIQRD